MRVPVISLLLLVGCTAREPLRALSADGAPADASADANGSRRDAPPRPDAPPACTMAVRPTMPDRAPAMAGTGWACAVADCADRGRTGNPCRDADLEPNDCLSGAARTGSRVGDILSNFGHWVDFALCPAGEVDWIGFDADEAQHVVALVTYRKGEGDLDAAIVDSAGRTLAVSQETSGLETVELDAPAKGRYWLVVLGADGQQSARYDFTIDLACGTGAPPCPSGHTCQMGRCRPPLPPDAASRPDAAVPRDAAARD